MASNEDVNKTNTKRSRAYLGNTQTNNPLSNPCIKEQGLSLKCASENYDDKDVCKAYFVNYRTCKEFWDKVKRERRAAGIKPYLPLPEEREEIKAKALGRK
ncbi:coiled-coil-helix-coiled-coil-helix domain-containing protein 7 [Venturia canescens]|uniref:coiled-coil-helix-coiled-coil-helix domain-containing protein 7 n=1 Tax=Venturia canescens TaxID=32260 RepID=UPI001C9D647F|nr:coiled-coil-helix-coiled-coil-helix domain-containing protein 7 [Venturia canescens]